MQLLLLLFSFVVFNACEPSIIEPSTSKMQQQNIIESVKKNDITAVKKLLNNGVDVNTRDKSGRSLLLIATIQQQAEMAKLLVTHSADVNLQADNLDSPFLYAGASGQPALVKLFLANGARFDLFNRYNGTALIPACERGHVEIVTILANTKGFPIDHVNRLGWTALLEAVILGNGSESYQQIVQVLKDAGANLTIADKDGVTPLQHARSRGFKEIAEILER
ncbi:MAG: ankyrin repeat domain-containing protein [Agriterribacter sp.]